MTNVTLSEALASREAVIPKYVSPEVFQPATSNVLSFLRGFERCATANGWKNYHKITYFGSFLDGAANIWYSAYVNDPANAQNTWKNVKEAFSKTFGGDECRMALKRKLKWFQQKEEQSIKEYYYDLLELLDEIGERVTDEDVQIHFEEGLHSKYRNSYNLLADPGITSDQLRNIVFKLSKQTGVLEYCLLSGREESKKEIKVLPTSPNAQTYSTQNRSLRTKNSRPLCYVCGKWGHVSYTCRNIVPVIRRQRCYVCNRTGHLARSCWNRKNFGSRSNDHGPRYTNSSQFENSQFWNVHGTQRKSPWCYGEQHSRAWSPPFQKFPQNQSQYGERKQFGFQKRHTSPQSRSYSNLRRGSRSPNRATVPEGQRQNIFQQYRRGTAPVNSGKRMETREVPMDINSAFKEMCEIGL